MVRLHFAVACLALMLTSSCQPGQLDKVAMSTALAATVAALPSATAYPTYTQVPTNTAVPPTPTPTAIPFTATATRAPTNTPTATASLTPTLAVKIPTDWKEYQDPVGRFVLRVPPTWTVNDQKDGASFSAVGFSIGNYGTALVQVSGDQMSVSDVGTADALNAFTMLAMSTIPSDMEIRNTAKGTWKYGVANTVAFALWNTTHQDWWVQYHIMRPLDPDHRVWVIVQRFGNGITDAEGETIETVMSSIRAK